MEIQTGLVYRYPWLPSLKKIFSREADEDPIEFVKKIFQKYPHDEIKNRITEIFEAAFNNLEQISEHEKDELNVHTYLILKIFLFLLEDNMITNRVANLYSKISYSQLIDENDSNVYDICQDLDLRIKYYQPPIKYGMRITKDQREPLMTNFRIHYIDYLGLSSTIRDEYRKLVNNPLLEGYVFLRKKDLIRLLQEYVRKKIMQKGNERMDPTSLDLLKKRLLKIPQFKEIFTWINDQWKSREEEFQEIHLIDKNYPKNISEILPPCIKTILNKANEGQNLIHNERLFLTWFLLSLNYTVDEVVNTFSTMPDFDREKTTYQVNYAKKKGYSPYKCASLKSLSLCMAEKYKDEVCLEGYYSKTQDQQKKITHPLSYVNIMLYRTSRKNENLQNGSDEKNE
ncbi:MAG: hypothetical protein EU539_02655 [Promethearchaeota archaeon]|nr:MAG: hypothetical protein EU539_02655 [Candidatus Lokiarchaeota archaeon]